MDDIIIRPTADIFIAALYSNPKHEASLLSLLNSVMTDIGEPAITQVSVLNPFNIQEYPDDKRIVLDVRVKDATGAFYNIEIQREPHTNFNERMLYYWSESYGSQLQRGQDYLRLRAVRSIIITEFPIFPMLQNLHAVFELRSRENPDILFTKHCQIHVLRLGNFIENGFVGLEQFGLGLRRWMEFWAYGTTAEEKEMTTMLQDAPEVLAAFEEYNRFKIDPAMREKVRARQRFLDDERLKLTGAYDEGIAIGEERGIGIGEDRNARKTALNMQQEGFDTAMISKMTGLSLSEIERLT